MRNRQLFTTCLTLSFCLGLAACGSDKTPNSSTSEANTEAPVETVEIAASFPESLRVIGDGYPASGGLCRRLGESAATSDWLDASAVLVGCPTEGSAMALGGKVVGKVEGITVVSIPTGDENAGMDEGAPRTASVTAAPKDIIRGKGGLEDKCKAAVAKQGVVVMGTNHIEESEAAIGIYVNVKDATAPWRCLGYKDGSIGEVEFTGSEGAL